MDVEPPTWLNKEFLALALQGGGGENRNSRAQIEVSGYTLRPAVAPGDNYTSQVFRVHVEYKVGGHPDQHQMSLIVKAPLEKGAIGEFSEKGDFFSMEPMIYKTVLPIFSEKVKQAFGPEYFSLSSKNIMVLKDLKPEGYSMCDRLKQLDIGHCMVVVNTLAKFHAASVSYHHDNPESSKTFQERFYTHKGPVVEEMKVMVNLSLTLFLETLKNKQLTMAHYMSERLDKIWDSVVDLCTPRPNSFNVLNHGDCWTSNLLFKYNDFNNITDVKFLDYQIVRYGSPLIDLLYFVWTSGNEDVRDNHQEALWDSYLKTLNQTLEVLDCVERFSREQLNAALKSFTDWVLLTVAFVVPFTLNDNDDKVDFGTITTGDLKSRNGKDEMYSNMFRSKGFQELLPGYVRQLEKLLTSG